MRLIKYAYEDAALEAAKVVTIDEERREAFVAGVKWCAEHLARKIAPSSYEDVAGYPKTLMDDLTLKDFRKTMQEFLSPKMVEL